MKLSVNVAQLSAVNNSVLDFQKIVPLRKYLTPAFELGQDI
jgi:hypothetical protein